MAKDLDDVVRQMERNGVRPPASVDLAQAFHRVVRFRPEGEKRSRKSAWVRLFEYRPPAPSTRVYITGVYGNRGDRWDVEPSDTDWSPAERAAAAEAHKAAARAAAAERQKDAETARDKARRFWLRGRELVHGSLGHPYLEAKQVGAYGVRLGFNDRLLVPLADVKGDIHGLQYISPAGEKIFGTGTAKEGRGHLIGKMQAGVPLLAFGEGYATCASVHMAMGWPVVTCFDAGNLLPVMQEWRRLYPALPFVVLADDDRHLLQRLSERLARHGIVCTPAELRESMDREWKIPDGPDVVLVAGWKGDGVGIMRIEGTLTVGGVEQRLQIENAGQAHAHAAARKCDARVLTPYFVDRESPHTDWNDLHCSAGIERVREQIEAALEAPPEKPAATARGKAGGDKPGRPGRGQGKGGGEGGGGGADGDMPFVERFTLIYGTTTVWDAQVRDIIRLDALRAAYGKLVDWWLGQDDRRKVPRDHVVFDPTGRCKPPDYVNLFDRLPLEPRTDRSGCPRVIEHLWNICQENDALFHWVTAWLAYPLQHPGAKMRTALVLHGRTEGTGKSKLGQVMRRIYGRYATSVGQAELQRDFNDWMSAKLLILAEEVVSRQDRAHHQGMLQALVTQETVQINTKNLPTREEANHANFIFFSNAQVPMLLNKKDRRYTVIRVEREQPPEYFAAIDAELDAGGDEAFYAYLLNYDLKGFNEYTRPFENRDRMHLITLGMSVDQRFFHFWQSGFAGVPFCCCPSSDLYQAFKAWCRVNGERFVPTATQFGRTVTEELDMLKAPEKRSKRYWSYSEKQIVEGDFKGDEDSMTHKQGIVYYVPQALERMRGRTDGDEPPTMLDPPPDVTEPAYFNPKIKLFQVALHELLASARRTM